MLSTRSARREAVGTHPSASPRPTRCQRPQSARILREALQRTTRDLRNEAASLMPWPREFSHGEGYLPALREGRALPADDAAGLDLQTCQKSVCDARFHPFTLVSWVRIVRWKCHPFHKSWCRPRSERDLAL